MGILINDKLKESLINELKLSTRKVDIVSAFCKIDALKFLDKNIPKDIEKRLLVRFRLSDLIMGVTDIELYEYCKENNWSLYMDTNLHAKIYLIDNKCFIGSANLTDSGLSITKVGNIEGSYMFEIENEEDYVTLERLFNQSVKLEDFLYTKMKKEYDLSDKETFVEKKWTKEIQNKIKSNFSVLLQEDFPLNDFPNNMDKDEIYLGISATDDIKIVKEKFEDSKIMKWLISLLESKEEKEIYFGELSERIHSLIFKEPKMYRKEVKDLQIKLYQWLMILDYNYLIIDTPVHSTRIKLLKENIEN